MLQLFFSQICKNYTKAETQKVLMKSEQVWNEKSGKGTPLRKIKNKHHRTRPAHLQLI